jgi:membrane protein YdbS with pleckstrin-like domain
MGKEKDVVLFNLKNTRKAFLLEYLCGVFLLIVLLIVHQNGAVLNPRAEYFVLGLALVSLISPEIYRAMHRYKITPSKLIVINGLIQQQKKHVYFYSLGFVPDINVRQSRFQRLLNYGTVFMSTTMGHFEVKDINSPHKIMEELERLIEKNKKHGTR